MFFILCPGLISFRRSVSCLEWLSPDGRLLKEEEQTLCGNPGNEQEGAGCHSQRQDRAKNVIARLAAQWSAFSTSETLVIAGAGHQSVRSLAVPPKYAKSKKGCLCCRRRNILHSA
jgi:hypothetical protein